MKALFSGENCPSWTNCEFAHNNYWYVQFDSEENAQKVGKVLCLKELLVKKASEKADNDMHVLMEICIRLIVYKHRIEH